MIEWPPRVRERERERERERRANERKGEKNRRRYVPRRDKQICKDGVPRDVRPYRPRRDNCHFLCNADVTRTCDKRRARPNRSLNRLNFSCLFCCCRCCFSLSGGLSSSYFASSCDCASVSSTFTVWTVSVEFFTHRRGKLKVPLLFLSEACFSFIYLFFLLVYFLHLFLLIIQIFFFFF